MSSVRHGPDGYGSVRMDSRLPLIVTAVSISAAAVVTVVVGVDEHVLSHGVAALILGLLAHGVVRLARRSGALAAAWPVRALFAVLVTGIAVQGCETVLAGLEGESGALHDRVVTAAGWLLLAAAALCVASTVIAVRHRAVNGWWVTMTLFLTWWSVMVNFVPYQGS